METLVLRTTYPCCGKPARVTAIVGVPREKYTRDCVACDTRHEVTRAFAGERGGVRVDTLTWVEVGPLPGAGR
jgi:hypothetical protein